MSFGPGTAVPGYACCFIGSCCCGTRGCSTVFFSLCRTADPVGCCACCCCCCVVALAADAFGVADAGAEAAVDALGNGGAGGCVVSLTLNHVSPDHAGPGSLLFCRCCGRSLYLSSKSSSVPSGLYAIVLL